MFVYVSFVSHQTPTSPHKDAECNDDIWPLTRGSRADCELAFFHHRAVNITLDIVKTAADGVMCGSLLRFKKKCPTKFDACLDVELVVTPVRNFVLKNVCSQPLEI